MDGYPSFSTTENSLISFFFLSSLFYFDFFTTEKNTRQSFGTRYHYMKYQKERQWILRAPKISPKSPVHNSTGKTGDGSFHQRNQGCKGNKQTETKTEQKTNWRKSNNIWVEDCQSMNQYRIRQGSTFINSEVKSHQVVPKMASIPFENSFVSLVC